jgi:16S rRNA (guanine527-N7)-methyltransferase
VDITLLDANERRTAFLGGEVSTWAGGSQVTVIRGRAEEIGDQEKFRQTFGLVTARSFGGPAVTAECGAPLLRPGGILVVSEPPDEDGSRWDPAGLETVGLSPSARLRFDDRFGYQVLVKSGDTPDRYPRRVGIPAKRPLF